MQVLSSLREQIGASGNCSHTSWKYQDDVAKTLVEVLDQGDCVVEVGCFKGGLTVQMAELIKDSNKPLFVVDISPEMIAETKQLLEKHGLANNVEFFLGDLQTFVNQKIGDRQPALMVVDGDHTYGGVVADIKAIESMKNQPYAMIFHDYSLRYIDQPGNIPYDTLVDRAIHDCWGKDFKFTNCGSVPEVGGSLNLKENPGPAGHYFVEGSTEGILVYWSDVAAKKAVSA